MSNLNKYLQVKIEALKKENRDLENQIKENKYQIEQLKVEMKK